MRNNYICAVDIGESKIAAALANVSRSKEITSLYLESAPSKGIEHSVVLNSTDLSLSFAAALNRIREKSGVKVKDVYISISGRQVISKHSNAIMPLSERGNKIITNADIKNIITQARILGSNLEEEIIHQIPFHYIVDGYNKVSDPKGLYGHKLEVDLFLVCVRLSFAQSLIRAINQAGYEVKDMFLPGIPNSDILFDPASEHGLNIICDIGADSTEMTVFHNGVLQAIEILPCAGDDITRALARELDIPFELASSIKESHGCVCDVAQLKGDREVMLKRGNIYKPVAQKAICEIISQEAHKIYSALKEKSAQVSPERKIDNFVVAGRTVLLDGFLEAMESALGFEVRLARILNSSLSQQISKELSSSSLKNLTYLNSLGIIQKVINRSADSLSRDYSHLGPVERVIAKAREVYQEYF